MALKDWEKFKGITNIRYDWYNQNLLYGILYWLRWSALQIGAFQNIDHSNASGVLGGDFSRLRLVNDPRYTSGQVWEGFRSDWVWESGIEFTQQPLCTSGVFVNGVFYPVSTTGVYAHYIDFPHGRVIFNAAISTSGSVVQADFAHRTISFVRANEQWFQELLFDSYRIERSDFLGEGSGQWSQLAETRRSLPAVGVEIIQRPGFRPYQLGGGQWVDQDVLFYIVTSNESDRNQWADVLSMQNDRTVWLPNRKLMKENVNYPLDLDYRGALVVNPMQYPALIAPTGAGGFAWTNVLVHDMVADTMDVINGWLYRATVRGTFTAVLSNI